MVAAANKKHVEWLGEEYARAVRGAAVSAFREAGKIVAKSARGRAPRWPGKHRVSRKYPGGRDYSDIKRLAQTIQSKVKDRRDRGVLAYVRVRNGYSVWVSYGHKIVSRGGVGGGNVEPNPFLHDALEKNVDRIIPILQGKMPK